MRFKLSSKRKNNTNVVVHGLRDAHASDVFIRDFTLFLPHYTPNCHQQTLVGQHVISRSPTQISYIERDVSLKNVDAQNTWSFEIRVKSCIDVPAYVIVGFQS